MRTRFFIFAVTFGCSTPAATVDKQPAQVNAPKAQPIDAASPQPAPPVAAPAPVKKAKPPEKPIYVTTTVKASSDDNKRSWRVPVLDRVWCESKSGDGIGESVTIEFAKPVEIDGLSLMTGLPSGAMTKPDAKYNRPTLLTLAVDGGTPIPGKPDMDNGGEVSWSYEPAKTASRLKISIAAVKRGKKRKSCLRRADISGPRGDLRTLAGPESSAADVPKAFAEIKAAFKTCDVKALQAVATFPFEWDALSEGYELPSRSKVRSAKELSKRCKGLDETNRDGFNDFGLDDVSWGIGSTLVVGASTELELRWTKTGWKASRVQLDML